MTNAEKHATPALWLNNGDKGEKNMPLEKPELGCKPYYVAASDRIEELSEAIQRYSRKSRLDYNRIREWAKEIEMLCDIVKTLDGYGDRQ